MSNQSISSLNIPNLDKKPISFQQNAIPSLQAPAMQGVTADKIKQNADNSYIANRLNASKEADPRAVLGATAGTWYLLSQGMDRFNPKCGGEYEKSILGRLGAFGDKIASTGLGRKIENGLRKIDASFYKLSKKSKIVYTLRNHSMKPECKFAKTPWAGLHGFLSMDTEQIFEEFLKPIADRPLKNALGMTVGHANCFQKLEQYGMSQKDIDSFVRSLNGKSYAEKALELQAKELELLGADSASIAKMKASPKGLAGMKRYAEHLKIKKLGFKSRKEYQALKGKFLDNPKAVIAQLEKIVKNDPNLKVSIWRKQGAWGKVKNHLFGRTASFSEYLNKYKATLGLGNKTKLGRFLPKAFGWFLEGTTNRFAGGKLGVLMQAYIFGDMLVNTFIAPKGEKIKTFAERFVNDFTYFIALTAGLIGMHKIGAFKYAGLDNKGREAYRKAYEKFKAKNNAKGFANKTARRQALRALKDKLGTKNIKNPITKLLHKAALLIELGNERIPTYMSPKKMNLNLLRKFANGNLLGVPIRIAIPLALVTPFLAKWATKAVHVIFGKPTHSVLDEDKEEETPKTENNTQTNDQNPVTKPGETTSQQNKNPNEFEDSNLIKQKINGKNSPTPDAQTPQVGQAGTENTNNPANETNAADEPVRTYIPSPEPVILQAPDETRANQALANADNAEKYIIDTLNSME